MEELTGSAFMNKIDLTDQEMPRLPSSLLSLGYREYPRWHNRRMGNQR
jgi:hypothetical protein